MPHTLTQPDLRVLAARGEDRVHVDSTDDEEQLNCEYCGRAGAVRFVSTEVMHTCDICARHLAIQRLIIKLCPRMCDQVTGVICKLLDGILHLLEVMEVEFDSDQAQIDLTETEGDGSSSYV